MARVRKEAVFRKRLGDEVKRLCAQRGWTQVEFARRLRTYGTEAARFRAGQVPTTLGNLERVASVFGVETHELAWRLLKVRRGEPDRDGLFEEVRSPTVGREEAAQAEDLIYQRIFADRLDGLESEDTRRIFDAVCRLTGGRETEALRTLADAAEGVTRRRGLGDSMMGVPPGSPSAGRLPGR